MATHFASRILHPGGSENGGDTIVFADPYPDDTLRPDHIHRVNIPFTTFMPLVWNKKTWNVVQSVELIANDGANPSYTFTGSVSGKLLSFSAVYNYQGSDGMGGFSGNEEIGIVLRSSNAEPANRIRAEHDEKFISHYGVPGDLPWDEITTRSTGGLGVLPKVAYLYSQIDGDGTLPITGTVDDVGAVESGNFELNCEWSPDDVADSGAGALVLFSKAWVKTDRTVDVFLEIRFGAGGEYGRVTDAGGGRVELVSQPVTPETDVCDDLGAVTLTLFGVSVTAYLKENLNGSNFTLSLPLGTGASSTGTITVTSFSFSYNVTPSALWTY